MNKKEENKMTEHKEKLQEIFSKSRVTRDGFFPYEIDQLIKQVNDLHKSDIELDEGKIRIISNDILKNFPITEDMDVLNMRGIDYIRLLDKLAHAIAQSGNALVKEKGVGG